MTVDDVLSFLGKLHEQKRSEVQTCLKARQFEKEKNWLDGNNCSEIGIRLYVVLPNFLKFAAMKLLTFHVHEPWRQLCWASILKNVHYNS